MRTLTYNELPDDIKAVVDEARERMTEDAGRPLKAATAEILSESLVRAREGAPQCCLSADVGSLELAMARLKASMNSDAPADDRQYGVVGSLAAIAAIATLAIDRQAIDDRKYGEVRQEKNNGSNEI